MGAPQSEKELITRALKIAGCRLDELAQACGFTVPQDLRRAKGWVGELLEKCLGATAGSRPVPDFEALGIELKTLPLNAQLKPQESTYVSSVPTSNIVGLSWHDSAVRAKLTRVLWVPVEAAHDIPLARRRIGRSLIWSPSPKDAATLQADWEEHMEHVALGRMDLLNARAGTYLQVRPKAMNSRARTQTTNEDGSVGATMPRGFYLRTSFTQKIIGEA